MGQPGLGPPPVGAHLDQPLDLGVLPAGRAGEPLKHRHAQRLARREQLDHGDRLGGQAREPGRHQLDQPAGRGERPAQRPDPAGHLSATLDSLGVPRPVADDIIAIVATLRAAVVTG